MIQETPNSLPAHMWAEPPEGTFSKPEIRFAAEGLYLLLGREHIFAMLSELLASSIKEGNAEHAQGWAEAVQWVAAFDQDMKAGVVAQ